MQPASHPPVDSSAEQCAQCAREKRCEACFGELVRRFQSPLLHFLIRRGGSRQGAEDLVQETFLTAYRNLNRYRSNWRFSTWLFTIANRLAISEHRRRRLLMDGKQIEPISDRGPLDDAQRTEMRSRLWDLAQRVLKPEAFTALWLCYVESMSAQEIGRVLGRNENAVRIVLHRARVRLSACEELSHEEK
jgi:RNA polymerase sigma-70 factor, ECF subfamily